LYTKPARHEVLLLSPRTRPIGCSNMYVMADINMDDLASQLMGIDVKAPDHDGPPNFAPATAAEEKKRAPKGVARAVDQAAARACPDILTPIDLADKYASWSSAQGDKLLDRVLPLADVEELSLFMCETIVHVTHEPGWKGGWSCMMNRLSPLPPLLHPSFPF
jgi:hypothetical protein